MSSSRAGRSESDDDDEDDTRYNDPAGLVPLPLPIPSARRNFRSRGAVVVSEPLTTDEEEEGEEVDPVRDGYHGDEYAVQTADGYQGDDLALLNVANNLQRRLQQAPTIGDDQAQAFYKALCRLRDQIVKLYNQAVDNVAGDRAARGTAQRRGNGRTMARLHYLDEADDDVMRMMSDERIKRLPHVAAFRRAAALEAEYRALSASGASKTRRTGFKRRRDKLHNQLLEMWERAEEQGKAAGKQRHLSSTAVATREL